MNQNKQFSEQHIQDSLRLSEAHLSSAELSRLSEVRDIALSEQNQWFAEYKTQFATGLVTATLLAVMIVPLNNLWLSGDKADLYTEQPVALLLEDPEFYFWLNETGLLVAER